MSTATAQQTSPIVNGVDTGRVIELASKMATDEQFGKFRFRTENRWIHDSRSRSFIQGFFAGGRENTDRQEAFTVDADQPVFLVGKNTAPNAVEYLLHSLTSCLSTTLVAHASVQGIELEDVVISAEGDMDARGFFAVSDDVNRGYEHIRVNIQVKSDADIGTLKALCMYSPVYEVVSRSVPVELKLTKI